MSAQAPQTPQAPAPKEPERLQKIVTVLVALIAATGAMTGFLHTQESGRAGAATRAGLVAQSQASEQEITHGRVLDQDFDYIIEAESLAFSADQYDAAGQPADANRSRALGRYLLGATYNYAYTDYYSDADADDAVYLYGTVGFGVIWAAYERYRDDLAVESAAAQATADRHFANASFAGRRADAYVLSIALMAAAVSMGAVALTVKSPRWKLVNLAVVATFYSGALANIGVTILG